MAKTGPLSERTWGRIWARAFTNPPFQKDFEKSPREAVKKFLGDFVEPLFDPKKNKKMKHCSFEIYDALDKRLTKDIASGGTEHFVRDLRAGQNLAHSEITTIINKLHGNEWLLVDKTKPHQPHRFEKVIPKDRGGTPKPPTAPLTLTEWAMVYAEAVLSDRGMPGAIVGFYSLLKKDAAGAVQDFVNAAPATFPHNATAPILELPTSADIFSHPNRPGDITSQADLDSLLKELEDDIDTDYECMLRICLSC
ncbi:MAG: hypothetical protein HOP18_10515 [Deltaproteobacteria bacterium]|nr:hypothetical protein [Deltaproteobacteria bacterium]